MKSEQIRPAAQAAVAALDSAHAAFMVAQRHVARVLEKDGNEETRRAMSRIEHDMGEVRAELARISRES